MAESKTETDRLCIGFNDGVGVQCVCPNITKAEREKHQLGICFNIVINNLKAENADLQDRYDRLEAELTAAIAGAQKESK